jgi:hypothetical protein
MKLLFSEDGFSEQFKKHLGFVDADFEFHNLLPDLKTATKDLIKVIGKETYEKIFEVSDSTEQDDLEEELLFLAENAIAVNAYRNYAPSNDISHTGDGRKLRHDEHMKSAFQWQIDSDNESLERRYYKALDNLLDFLDGLNDEDIDELSELITGVQSAWNTSEARKELKSIFVNSVDIFDRYYVINSRHLLLKLAPGMKRFERLELASRIGKEYLEELRQLNDTGTDDIKKAKLIDLICEACVSYAFDWALPKMSINLFPSGLVQSYTSDRASTKATKPPMLNESEWARQSFAKNWQRTLLEIEQELNPEPTPQDITDANINPPIFYGDKHFTA